jgi:signal transduction histidine kinase
MDRKEMLAKLTRAHDEIGKVVDAIVEGDGPRLSWTRLLAHNVNNHLTSIFYIIERFVQTSKMSPADQAAYVNALKDVAERIHETIRRLMALSQSDSLVQLAPVDLLGAVSESLDRASGYAELKGIDLRSLGVGSQPIVVEADRLGLIESLLNVIGNAIKYSPRGSRVEVAVQRDGEHVEVRVQDQGPGLSADDQAKLFGVGAVLTSKPTAGEPQTGIGLAMTRELMRAMGGSVRCESTLGNGAMFAIRLPLRRSGGASAVS